MTTSKFVLKVNGIDLYLSSNQSISGVNYCSNIKKAMKFDGRDNADDKISIWNAAAKIQHNNSDVNFSIIYL